MEYDENDKDPIENGEKTDIVGREEGNSNREEEFNEWKRWQSKPVEENNMQDMTQENAKDTNLCGEKNTLKPRVNLENGTQKNKNQTLTPEEEMDKSEERQSEPVEENSMRGIDQEDAKYNDLCGEKNSRKARVNLENATRKNKNQTLIPEEMGESELRLSKSNEENSMQDMAQEDTKYNNLCGEKNTLKPRMDFGRKEYRTHPDGQESVWLIESQDEENNMPHNIPADNSRDTPLSRMSSSEKLSKIQADGNINIGNAEAFLALAVHYLKTLKDGHDDRVADVTADRVLARFKEEKMMVIVKSPTTSAGPGAPNNECKCCFIECTCKCHSRNLKSSRPQSLKERHSEKNEEEIHKKNAHKRGSHERKVKSSRKLDGRHDRATRPAYKKTNDDSIIDSSDSSGDDQKRGIDRATRPAYRKTNDDSSIDFSNYSGDDQKRGIVSKRKSNKGKGQYIRERGMCQGILTITLEATFYRATRHACKKTYDDSSFNSSDSSGDVLNDDLMSSKKSNRGNELCLRKQDAYQDRATRPAYKKPNDDSSIDSSDSSGDDQKRGIDGATRPNDRKLYDDSSYENSNASCTEGKDTCGEWVPAMLKADKKKMDQLINENKLPNNEELQKLFHLQRKQSDATRSILERVCFKICESIKSESNEIKFVWPAYKKEMNRELVFVVLCDVDISLSRDYPTEVRGTNSCNNEAAEITKLEENYTGMIENEIIKATIKKHRIQLFENHSNIQMISSSAFKSKGYTHNNTLNHLELSTCIVLYVNVKGVIPLFEEPFPQYLECPDSRFKVQSLPVDVREGIVTRYLQPGECHAHVRMGCQISGNVSIGTLGGFIEIDRGVDNKLYGLTCAHIFIDGHPTFGSSIFSGNGRFVHTTENECPVYQPGIDSRIGNVVLAFYNEGTDSTGGAEVAIFEICDERRPIDGHFPEANTAHAGFSQEHQMKYESGMVYDNNEFESQSKVHQLVYKFGCSTHCTVGKLRVTEASIRPMDFMGTVRSFGLPLHNQLEIMKIGEGPFASHGDSGAIVFMKHDGDPSDLRAVGIVEGGTSFNTCVVTPMWEIFSLLRDHLNNLDFQTRGYFRFKCFSPIHELESVPSALAMEIDEGNSTFQQDNARGFVQIAHNLTTTTSQAASEELRREMADIKDHMNQQDVSTNKRLADMDGKLSSLETMMAQMMNMMLTNQSSGNPSGSNS